MMFRQSLLIVLVGALASPTADAQFGFHIDHHNHIVRDRHGHVLGQYHHDVIHRDSRYVVPHAGGIHHGTYSVRNGVHLYYPQTAAVGAVELAPVPEQLVFGGFGHVDDLALRMETLLNDLCLDLYYNYSHNPGFGETYTEAYSLLQTAKYIHDAEHNRDRDAIRSRLGGADALFHHIQDDLRGWTRIHRRQIGTLGILTKMEMTEATLHHMMNDVGVNPVSEPEQAPRPLGGPEQAPPPDSLGLPIPRN